MLSILLLLSCARSPVEPGEVELDVQEVDPTDPSPADPPDSPAAPSLGAIVHLFEWPWQEIATECEEVLGPAGFAAVQVSPPQEHAVIEGRPWWERYQPVSYAIAGRGGNAAEFADMVARCGAVGVDVYVDAVLNHMAWGGGTGTGGTSYGFLEYGDIYTEEHFHDCEHGISNWGSRDEMQNCRLATLPDLATEHPHVRQMLTGYLQTLVDLGVDGFRIDAAKHMPAGDLAVILNEVTGEPFVFQEILSLHDGDVISTSEYTHVGRVTELRYGAELSRVFREDKLHWLDGFGEGWDLMPSSDALVFIDNHDNQRGHGAGDPLSFEDGGLYRIANVFMLAWPYGRPKIMSSYRIDDPDIGPPPASPQDACGEAWICEHRWPAIRGMVGFRNVAGSAPVQHWWSNGNDQIAFARGDRAFVVLNREELPTLERTFDTGLPEGTYCDVLTGGPGTDGCVGATIEVDASGLAEIRVGPLDAVALHVDARR